HRGGAGRCGAWPAPTIRALHAPAGRSVDGPRGEPGTVGAANRRACPRERRPGDGRRAAEQRRLSDHHSPKGERVMRVVASLLLIGAIVTITGCASTPTAPAAVNVTGKWAGNWTYPDPALGGGTLSGTFQQDGGNLSGNFLIIGGGNTVRYPAASV